MKKLFIIITLVLFSVTTQAQDLPKPKNFPKDSVKVITLTTLQSEKVALYETQMAEIKQKQNELIVFILDAHNVKIDKVRDLKYNNGKFEVYLKPE